MQQRRQWLPVLEEKYGVGEGGESSHCVRVEAE